MIKAYKFFLSIAIGIIIHNIFYKNIIKDIDKLAISKDIKKELRNIKKYIYLAQNEILIDKYLNLETFKSDKPKISIVIPIYNGENYIKKTLISIQNQDLKDIEILMIDDFSNDNSIKIIKELMKKDPRIVLYENEENKGILYTKSKGIYLCKGKYVIIIDEDDMFGQREALSTLYELAEKDNLDMLGFSAMFTESIDKNGFYIHHYYETPIIFQPNIAQYSHNFTSTGKVSRTGDNIWCYLFKTELLNQTIFKIKTKYLKTKMICHEDYLILFLITRNANKLRQIKKIFYIKITYGKPKKYTTKSNDKNKMDLFCQSYINYIEFILKKTKNNFYDKKISSFELDRYFLNHECINNTFIRKRAIKVCKLFIKNKYIEINIKTRILKFLNGLH